MADMMREFLVSLGYTKSMSHLSAALSPLSPLGKTTY
jgi:hypothetical protein